MTEVDSSIPLPRDLGVMIVNGIYNPEENNVDQCIDELLAYMPEEFPRKAAQLQIESIIKYKDQPEPPPPPKKKQQKLMKVGGYFTSEPSDDETRVSALKFALNWFGRNNRRYFPKLLTDIQNNFPDKFTSEEARWIANLSNNRYLKAIKAIPSFKSAQTLLHEKNKIFSLKSAYQPKTREEVEQPTPLTKIDSFFLFKRGGHRETRKESG